jgi:hypothetical protein
MNHLFFGGKLTLLGFADFLFDYMPFNISDYILGLCTGVIAGTESK